MICASHSTPKVALLATGDEIITGDILNTNTQAIAERLTNELMQIGMHLATIDNIDSITNALQFLLLSHQAIVITGGLGPTSDDLTRFALAKVLGTELVFDEGSWEKIVDRLQKLGYQTPPASNRQQALFPENAVILPNENGTAAGCYVRFQEKLIFMLPGPPNECLPMINQFVIPELKKFHFDKPVFREKWLLFNVSEGQVAEKLDALVSVSPHVKTGYRLQYPYLEFKMWCDNPDDFAAARTSVADYIQEKLINDGKATASDLLLTTLITHAIPLTICDHATKGALENKLMTPKTLPFIKFVSESTDTNLCDVFISGLDEFWHQKQSIDTTLTFTFTYANQKREIKKTIPFRGERVKTFAIECICREILMQIFAVK